MLTLQTIVSESEARKKILLGVKKMTNLVAATLGPHGKNIPLEEPLGDPHITKDGVTVAKRIEEAEAVENLSIQAVKGAATRANIDTGDGTTSATLLTYEVLRLGMKQTSKRGARSSEIREGMDAAARAITSHIRETAHKVDSDAIVEQIVRVSCNDDDIVTQAIVDAHREVSEDGLILSGITQSTERTSTEIIQGLQMPVGLMSRAFARNAQEFSTELHSPHIIIYNGGIRGARALQTMVETWLMAQDNKSAILIADSFEGDSLTQLMAMAQHKQAAAFVIPLVRPNKEEHWMELIGDLAAATGAKLLGQDEKEIFETIKAEHFNRYAGTANQVIVSQKKTDFMGWSDLIRGRNIDHDRKLRRQEIATELDNAELSPTESKRLRTRLSVFDKGAAIIKAGGATPIEARERRDRLDDAIGALRSSYKHGVVAGGGTALLDAGDAIAGECPADATESFRAGWLIVAKACSAPMRKIADNGGYNGKRVVRKKRRLGFGYGWDAKSRGYVNMTEEGIIDPANVVTTSLEAAVSVAGSLATIGGAVVAQTSEDIRAKMASKVFPRPW